MVFNGVPVLNYALTANYMAINGVLYPLLDLSVLFAPLGLSSQCILFLSRTIPSSADHLAQTHINNAVIPARVPRKNENPFVHISNFSYLYALICIMRIVYLFRQHKSAWNFSAYCSE